MPLDAVDAVDAEYRSNSAGSLNDDQDINVALVEQAPTGQSNLPQIVNPLTPLKVTGSKVPLQVSPLPLKGIASGNPLIADEAKATTGVKSPAFVAATDEFDDDEELQVAVRRDPEEEYFMLAVLANKMI